MSTPSAQQEPTMEEILASIRRIISEDAEAAKPAVPVAAAPAPAPVAAPAAVPQPVAMQAPAPAPAAAPVEREPEVLELTNIVMDDGTVGREREPDPIPEPPRRRPAPRVEPEPIPEPRVSRRAPAAEPRYMRNQSDLDMVEKDDGILSSQASSAINNAFGMLSRERDVSVSGASLEDIVTQIMKPLLAQWLDEHLPEIVERVVQQEIERAARSGGRRR
jgi:cell pole-organizing protein PopZ